MFLLKDSPIPKNGRKVHIEGSRTEDNVVNANIDCNWNIGKCNW